MRRRRRSSTTTNRRHDDAHENCKIIAETSLCTTFYLIGKERTASRAGHRVCATTASQVDFCFLPIRCGIDSATQRVISLVCASAIYSSVPESQFRRLYFTVCHSVRRSLCTVLRCCETQNKTRKKNRSQRNLIGPKCHTKPVRSLRSYLASDII